MEWSVFAGRRQVIDITNVKDVALIKVGAGIGLPEVIGVDKRGVIAVRGVVERMTVSIGRTKVQSANSSPERNLQGVVSRVCLRFKKSNRLYDRP
jgi:hypothetical protein